MAGSGVNVGGTAMLRTRRRDVSIKPNRRLDRKSSRGMIYENEELRLRTININAEVEQGQNDIKKLRKENEQLRKEIWSLRDEYDKLEELVKNQSSQGSSDDLEGRSGEENNVEDVSYTEYSGDEDVVKEGEEGEEEEEEEEDDEEEADEGEEGNETILRGNGKNQDEHLDNAENLKISSEKMNSGIHRLHVDFDDLSVVDEEEELKKEKEKKDSVISDDSNQLHSGGSELLSMNEGKCHSSQSQDLNFRYFHTPVFDLRTGNLTAAEEKYFTDSPFVFPNPSDPNYPKMLPMDNSNIIMSPCSKMYNGQLTPLPNLDTPAMGPVDTIFGNDDARTGVQKQQKSGSMNSAMSSNYSILGPNVKIISGTNAEVEEPLCFREISTNPLLSGVKSLTERRNTRFKQPVNFFDDTLFKNPTNFDTPSSGDAVTHAGWDFSKPLRFETAEINCAGFGNGFHSPHNDQGASNSTRQILQDKPKHFFAPLPSKLKMRRSNESGKPFAHDFTLASSKALDTATSSSSDKTSSTVVSRNHNNSGIKGTADVYVNGVYPFSGNNNYSGDQDLSAFLSSENLLVEEVRNISRQSSSNPLVKSISCQDLSSEPQSLPFSEKLKMFNADNCGGMKKLITKSDNTLDSISANSPRPFKSQLNVTLKLPKQVPSSPNTPEIPKLPEINYRLFNNPFLQNYHNHEAKFANFNIEGPVTRPLSIQVNEDPRNTTINNNFAFKSKVENDQRLLLMAANQFRNLGDKIHPRRANLGFEVTSFEGPSPQTLLPEVNPILHNQRLYNNIPNGQIMFPGNLGNLGNLGIQPSKVPAQTQTSINGDSQVEENEKKLNKESQGSSVGVNSGSPISLRRKRTLRKERSGSIKDKRPLSPAAQRRKDRLRKQNSVTSTEPPESPVKTPQRSRKFSVVTTSTSTGGEVQEKNESRSSSSGQDSPKKISEQRRRVSLYFNSKKRPSLVSTKMERRSSVDNVKDGRFLARNDPLDGTTTNSERERTNSVSSRDTAVNKGRKMSTGSGKVPWCACWGNGCV